MRRQIHELGVLAIGVMVLLSGCHLGPRPTSSAMTVAAAPDAEALLLIEAIRNDQRAFEVFRRSRLLMIPPVLTESFTCPEKLGIYCIDRVMGGVARIRHEEEPAVTLAREALIESLRGVAARVPGDGWVQGQLVRYLVEAGDPVGAVAAASRCQATPTWWCWALAGYAYRNALLPAEADLAFENALALMPAVERDLWLDPSPLLDPGTIEVYAVMEEEDLAHFTERFWRVADPLLTRTGNLLLTEHLVRRVELNLQLDAETVEGPLLGRSGEEIVARHGLLVRYGLPSAWVRGMGKMGLVQIISRTLSQVCVGPWCGNLNWVYTVQSAESGEVAYLRGLLESRGEAEAPGRLQVGAGIGLLAPPLGVRDLIAYYDVPPQSFLPPPTVFLAKSGIESSWDRVEEVPWAGYEFPGVDGPARWIAPLAHQLAVFPRGDSAIVVAGWDLPAHGISELVGVEAGAAFLPSDDLLAPATIAVADDASASGVVAARVAARPSLVSIESVVPEEGVIARARYRIELAPLLPNRFAMSDLLLLHGGEEEFEALADAVQFARGSDRLPPGELLGIYWEIYGLDAAASSEVAMSIELHNPPSGVLGGVLRWLGEALRVVGAPVPVRTEWMEEVVPGPWMGRSLNLRIPEVSEGRYALVLTATVPGREPVVAVREIEVTRSIFSTPSLGRMVRRPDLTRPTRCVPEIAITASAFDVADSRAYFRLPLCAYTPDPSWFGHYGGSDHLSDYEYAGW